MFEKPESERGLLLTMISKALFGLPNVYRVKIETLWVDQHALSYSFSPMLSWRKHISNTVEDLKQKMSWVKFNCYCCGSHQEKPPALARDNRNVN